MKNNMKIYDLNMRNIKSSYVDRCNDKMDAYTCQQCLTVVCFYLFHFLQRRKHSKPASYCTFLSIHFLYLENKKVSAAAIFDQVQVLGKTKKYFLRFVKESIEILKHPNNLIQRRKYFQFHLDKANS